MKDDICTIPINDGFLPKKGCPICRLEKMLEDRYVEYITGSAMMEPDVRIETNKTGFCGRHFGKMLGQSKRLQNALILESHLQYIMNEFIPKSYKKKPDKKAVEALGKQLNSCFICEKINWGIDHLFSTVFSSWQKDPEFRELFEAQEYICLPHYHRLMAGAVNKGLPSKLLPEFHESVLKVTGRYLTELKGDVTHFCSMFDYRSQGKDWGNSKDSIERSIKFLTGDKNEV